MTASLSLTVNGEPRRSAAATIAALVRELELKPEKVAVERNGVIVPRSTLGEAPLADGDVLEIVTFVGGVITGLTVWCVGFGKYGIHTPLGPQLLTAVYTAIVAWPSLWVLTRMRRVFRFKTSVGR